MRGKATELASTMIVLIPAFWIIGIINIGIFDSVEDREGQIGSIRRVEQGLYTVFPTRQGESVNFIKLYNKESVIVGPRGIETFRNDGGIRTPKVELEMEISNLWRAENEGRL